MDTDDFVSAYEKDKNQYLENKTNKIIRQEIIESLKDRDKETILKKLSGYSFVDAIDHLHIGKITR